MSLASQPATRAGGPRPDDSDDDEDDGPPGDLYQPSHFQDTQCGDLAQPSHFGTGETLAELSARMSQLESVSRRNTRASMETLHMALHPKLRDPIPPLPIKRADGAFGMTLRAPPSRVPAAPF